MTALAALCGAGLGLGVLLLAAGWRGTGRASTPRRWASRLRADRALARTAAALAAGVVVGALTGWPVGAVHAVLAAFFLPRLRSGRREHAAAVARVEALASWAEMLRDTLAGAAGLEQAIHASAPVAPLPIRRQVAALAARLEADRLPVALRGFADELADPTADLIVAALVLAAEHQARRLGDLLGTLASAARDQVTMRLRVDAGRARTRTSVKVVIGATLALALGMAVLNRGYLTPYDNPVGQFVLLLVGALFSLAFGWLTRMTRPDRPDRILADSPTAVR